MRARAPCGSTWSAASGRLSQLSSGFSYMGCPHHQQASPGVMRAISTRRVFWCRLSYPRAWAFMLVVPVGFDWAF